MGKKKHMLGKNLSRTIRGSLGRFVAIVAIIALGAGFFVGLLQTKSDMVETGQWYTDKQNMFDLHLLCTYGWRDTDVTAVGKMPGVAEAEGAVCLDVLMEKEGTDTGAVYRLMSIPEKINRVELQGGRMPQSPDECLADGFYAGDWILGTRFTVSETNAPDTTGALSSRTYTVVGYVSTPLYLNMERGNTSVGSGRVASYLYLMPQGFQIDYYTDLYITLPGDYGLYTDAYDDAMDAEAELLEPLLEPLAQRRLTEVREQAEAEYQDGLREYEDGAAAYKQGKKDAEKQLADGRKKLLDGQKELDANKKTIQDGKKQLADGQKTLDEQAALLLDSQKTLADSENEVYTQLAQAQTELMENYKTVKSGQSQAQSGLAQINSGLNALESGISQLESGLSQLESGLSQLDSLISLLDVTLDGAKKALEYAQELPETDAGTLAQLEEKVAELTAKREDYASQRENLLAQQAEYGGQLEDLREKREEVLAQKAELEETVATLDSAMAEIDTGFLELESSQTQAENRFAAARAQLEVGQMQLDSAQKELDEKSRELADGEVQLQAAQAELDAGWEEYNTGKEKSDRELKTAAEKLAEGKARLQEARETIDNLEEPSVYALTRNTNVGYRSLQSDSDIVSGVSRVFPGFFLLVAALVCITTMTRMVNEERTQIGTFKALGYSNGAIIGKYLAYSGIAAVTGCSLGVLVGGVAFPQILWQGYRIMYNITPWVRLHFDWPLCIAVVAVYTALTLLATWYCCRRELREVPAELIRPKAPTSGKKIFLEHLWFWNKIGFLSKVAARNVFRYRQRLLMMLLGVGGCTALLVTGFGVGDSISNVVDYQFREVTVYDMAVSFRENQSPADQEALRERLAGSVDEMLFCHQSSVELDTGHEVKEVYLLAPERQLDGFVDLHHGERKLLMPGTGEALISSGAAEAMGIHVGDRITVRNPQRKTVDLTVAGIFDNHVYNYVVTDLQGIRLAWGETYAAQTALITTRADQDVHQASASLMNRPEVLNVLVCQDLAGQVDAMMEAMDLIVATIAVCAGLLAGIVLYNLTNINITERVREIATIKVLGFRAGETAAYVFKENLVLTGMGAALGLIGGKLLLEFVMQQIKLDMVWFQARVSVGSYLLAIALTLLAACLVNLVFYFRLEKINMAEALKSVE